MLGHDDYNSDPNSRLSNLRRLLHDAWVVLGLIFGQMILTYLIVALVPYGFLVTRAYSSTEIKQNLDSLNSFAAEPSHSKLSSSEVMEQIGPTMRVLLEAVPWFWLALVASILIYPFLGWWAARLLYQPQRGGLVMLASVLSQQNVAVVPRNLEYMNLGKVGLPLWLVLILVGFQFLLLTMGILAQRGQVLVQNTKESDNDV